MIKGKISRITGPVVVAEGMTGAKMWEAVEVGKIGLLGEIIKLVKDKAIIEVFEDTYGLEINEPVKSSGKQFTIELGPGLIGCVYDGLERPLDKIKEDFGDFISRGIRLFALDRKKKWEFKPKVKKGDKVYPGFVLGEVKEKTINHKILVPHGVNGIVKEVYKGDFNLEDVIAILDNGIKLKLFQEWPVKKQRPYKSKIGFEEPLITGQRVLDSFFPIAKGGNACVPGGFGSGKTLLEHCIIKNCDADITIFVGCGERGNEICDLLTEFPKLKDRKTGKSLMEKSIIIANTSNMPVVARETSIYTGITLGEYFRDQGYNVLVTADSTSRWAEALREVSGRLEELPGEEGFPVYLESNIANFYERSGRVKNLNDSVGSLTLICSVSPPGGDFSEPVTVNSLRIAKVLWALDQKLSWRRHFPAVNWLISYSKYVNELSPWFKKISPNFLKVRKTIFEILHKETEIERILRIVGLEGLPEKEKFIIEIAKIIKEDFLQQDAFNYKENFTSIEKQYEILKEIVKFYKKGIEKLKEREIGEKEIRDFREKLNKIKFGV